MGYTHYWQVSNNIDDQHWNAFKNKVQRIVDGFSGKICGGDGEGLPEITDSIIWLNGDTSLDEDFETLIIERDNSISNFCKTGRRPYDTVVVAILIIGAFLGILESWSSDGEERDGDFNSARKLLDSI